MSQDHIELSGSNSFQLRRVDHIISELGRPVLWEDSVAPSTLDALVQLGISVGGDASRKDLIEQLWGRKRALLRLMSAVDDSGPLRPVA